MTRKEEAARLRADAGTHYNCCQSVLIPFCGLCGLDREAAFRLGEHFGAGMRMGAVCGAVTGGLMVLGMAGAGEEKAKRFRAAMQERYRAMDCATLLRRAHEQGIGRKPHCDGMVLDAVELLEGFLAE